ncbi:CHAT domain-containing protein [Terfezia claveryi]|nr:CHAT domain-containing protein [Terfezia claveryi]
MACDKGDQSSKMKLRLLEAAIRQAQRAVEAKPEGHPTRPRSLMILGNHLNSRYRQTGNMQDLEAAIARTEEAVQATPEDHPDRRGWLNNLGNRLSSRYEQTGNLQDLEAVIARLEGAVQVTPGDHPELPALLKNIARHLRIRYDRTGNLKDLEDASAQSEAAVQATTDDHSNPEAEVKRHQYDRTKNMQDLESAITRLVRGIEPRAENQSALVDLWLGWYTSDLYEPIEDLLDLEVEIARLEAAIHEAPHNHPSRAGWLNTLGLHLGSRYEQSGNLQDLEAAIARLEEGVQATSEGHPKQAGRLGNLGAHLGNRYKRTGDLQDLEAAIALSQAAVERTPEGVPERAHTLNSLGNHLFSRYERTGNLQDLEAAIVRIQESLQATPEENPHRATRLSNLGTLLCSRYERTGNLQDLEGGIAQTEEAVRKTPEDHPDRASRLGNLGENLSIRYKRTGILQDLESCIARSEEAVRATPKGHPDRASLLSNLGVFLIMRYERTENRQNLRAAIARTEEAVRETPEDHPDRASRLGNLGTHLGRRYDRTGIPQDLETAITLSQEALQATPDGHPQRAYWLNNLGSHLSNRYKLTGNLQDSETANARAEEALQEIPEDHPDRANMWSNLGEHLISRYEGTGNPQDLKAALAAKLAAWGLTFIRIRAALRAADMLVFDPLVKDLPTACTLLQDVMQLLPLVTPRSLGREDQQHILGYLTGLASLAASVCFEVGESPLEALRLQELGRSVTNSQLLDYRSDISDLMKNYPTLAEEFGSLREELDSPFGISSIGSPDMSIKQCLKAQQSTIRRRNKVVQDLDHTLMQIRQKPGFENFLRSESEAFYLSAAHEGPIVVLNVTKLRSDAILITKAAVKSIALQNLSHASMVKHCVWRTSDNEVMRRLLEWLWKGAVQPVLSELGFYPKKIYPLPRIWWIGVGLMVNAPIHAAAKFKKGRIQMTTLQYCLPSYTSTFRSLQFSRTRKLHCQQDSSNSSTLLVTMPTTPGARSLAGVTEEMNGIKESLRHFSRVETLERPCAERVLQALPNYSIAHFACHGLSDFNPANSHLLLLKESTPHGHRMEELDRLRVNDIAALKLPKARLAYLSACSTAESPSERLSDEATHIVSSFHIAGFSHVIGTLWRTNDQACQKMAVDFYSMLSKTDDVAVSYRFAIMGLMKEKPMQPLYWAPFIHFGA